MASYRKLPFAYLGEIQRGNHQVLAHLISCDVFWRWMDGGHEQQAAITLGSSLLGKNTAFCSLLARRHAAMTSGC